MPYAPTAEDLQQIASIDAAHATRPYSPSHQDLHEIAFHAAQQHGIDPQTFINQIRQESGFNPKAMSPAGAQGIAQIVPKWHPGVDPMDPVASLNYAANLMANGIKKYGSVERALSAYNSGRPDAYLDPHFANGETYNYVRSILGHKAGMPVPAGQTVPVPSAPVIQPLPEPNLQPGQMGAALPQQLLGDLKPLPVLPQAQQGINQALQTANTSLPAPVVPHPLTLQQARNNAQQLVQFPQVPVQQQQPNVNPIQGLGNLFNAAGQGIAAGAGNVWNAVTHPQQLIQQGINAGQHSSLNPIDILGGTASGAVHGLANAANSLLDLPAATQNAYEGQQVADPLLQIPTGGLEEYEKDKQIPAFLGNMAPWIAADILTGGTAEGVHEANIARQLLQHTATGAAFGVLGAPGSIQERASNAVQMGALGAGLGAAGEGLRLVAGKKGEPIKLPAADENTSASLNPEQTTANAPQLAQDFQNRTNPPQQLILPKEERKPYQVLGPDGQPIVEGKTGIPSAYEAALSRAGIDTKPETGKPIDILKSSAIPEGRQLPDRADQEAQAIQALSDSKQTIKDAGFKNANEMQRFVDNANKLGEDSGVHPEELKAYQDILEQHQQAKFMYETVIDGRLPSANELALHRMVDEKPVEPEAKPPVVAPESPKTGEPVNLLDSTGRPMNESEKPTNIIQFPNKSEPTEHPEILGANGKPLFRPPIDTSKADVMRPEEAPADVKASVAEAGGQLVDIAKAEKFLRDHGRTDELDHLLNAVTSARQSQSWERVHQSIEKGGQVTTTREATPVAVEMRTISPQREVQVLKHDNSPDGSGANADLNAVRDDIVQRLAQNKVKYPANAQNIEGLSPRFATRKLGKLAALLPEHERTHVYVHDHNPGETSRAETNGFGSVRLDRMTESRLTGKEGVVPKDSEFQNKIAPAYDALKQVMNRPDASPRLKTILNQMSTGKVTRQAVRDLTEALQNESADVLKALCELGL